MPIYNLNNRRYNIPDDVVNDFERDNPDATIAYNADGNIYDIPVSKKQGFLQKFPNATLHDDLPQAEGQVVNNTISGGIGTQEEADSLFELNAARFNEKDPIKRAALDMQYNQFENSLKEKQNQQLRNHLEESGEIKRLQEVQGKAQLEIDKASFFDRFFNANTRAAVAARDVAEEALEAYSEANQKNDGWFDKNVGGVLRGIFDKVGDLRTWDFGASGISSAVALKDASEKLERGEALTPTEQNMLDAYGLSAAVQAAYQEKVGTAYRVGGSLPESFAFGASLAINPAGGVGKKIAETAAKAAVKKYGTGLVSKLAKGAARVGGDIAEMGVATAVPGAGRVAEDYYNRLNGQSTFDIDNNGIIRYGGQVEQEEADDAIWKAFGSQFIENYSEAMGNYFAPMGTMLSNLTSKGLKAGGLGKLAEAVSDISSSQWSKGLQRFKDAVKFDGLVGEYLEEVAGNFMNAATVGDMNFNSPEDPRSVFNPDTNIETFLSCALLSGTMYAVEAPITLYNKYTAKKNLRNADSAASSLLGNRWEDLRNQMDSASPEHLAQILTGVQNAVDLSNEQKQAVKEYASRLMQSQGFNARNVQNAQETTPETAEANNAYNEGSENDAPQYVFKANRERVKAGNALKAVDENVASVIDIALETGESVDVFINSLDENVAPLARDYYNKSLRMRGVIDGVMDRAEDAIAEEEKIIRSVTDPSTGMYTEISRLVTNPQTGEREAQPGYVVGWIGEGENRMPTFLPEGVENIPENRVSLKPTEFDAASIERLPMDEVLSLNAEMIRERAKKDLNDKASMAEQVYNYVPKNEDQVIGTDGQVLTITGVTPDGIVYANEQGQVEQMSLDEWKGLLQAQLDAQEAAQAEAAKVEESNQSIVEGLESKPMEDGTGRVMQPKGVQGNEVVYDITDGNGTVLEEGSMDAAEYNGVGEESKVSGQGADNIGQGADSVGQERTEAPVIPTKEDGSIDFVSYGKEGTFKTLGEKYGEKMPNKVSVTAKALADDLVKAQKKLDKSIEEYDNAPIGREEKAEKARDKAQQELDAIKREADFWAEMDAEIKDAQFRRASILNPQAEVETSTEPMNADEFVAQQLASGNIVLNKEDYKSETGYGDAEANALNGGAAKLFGENGMTIQEAGERLMEIDRENGTNFFDQNDSNAGRDALISLLGSVKSRKELNQYIASNRSEQAKKESEGLRNELEKQAMEANYASLEDYVLQMEAAEMEENPFRDIDVAQIDAIFVEAEEEYQNYINNEQGRTSEVVEGDNNVLPEEQADNTGGTSGVESEGNSERNGEGTSEASESTHASTEVELKQEEGETTLQFAERAAEENRRRPLRKRAEEWSNTLGVKVTYLESIDDVDAKTRAQIEAAHAKGSSVPGWVNKKGEVFFFMPDLSDLKDVDDTYIHEVVAHVGLPQLLGKERFGELCDKVWEMMPQSAKDYYMSYPGVNNHRDAADEYIAHLAEQQNLTPEERTIWDNIVKMFREMLDKALNGIISKSKLTDEDISNLIKASYANLKSGAEGGSVGEGIRFDIKNKPTLNIVSVGDFISKMKSIADIAPQIKATDETWIEKISTPIGEIKMGEHQKTKFYKNGREEFYGMAIDTLRNPNVILVEYDKEYNPRHERPFSYLFVKTFKKEDGSDYVHFESVTVAQEGLEVSISSHHLRENQLEEKLKTDRLLYKATALDESATPSAEQSINDGSRSSDNKDNASEVEMQEKTPLFRVVNDKNGKKTLVGLHNISEDKLRKAIKQGGLANPSMAVIDMDKQSHVDYGDITLVAPAELIDKNTGRSAGTYMGDAWTPVYPKVTLQLDNKGWKKINQYIESIVEDRELQNSMKYGVEMYMEGENGMYMNFAFLKAKGLNPEIFYKNNDGYISTDDIKKLLGVEEIDTSFEGYSKLKDLPEETLEELKLWARTYGNKANIDSHKKRLEEIKNQYGEDSKAYKLMAKPSDELGYGEFDRLVVDTKRKERDNGKIDSYKTFNEANYYVAQNGLRQEFENWMDELLLGAGAKEVFFAGYTPSGNKRYMANTIENVSKFMNKQSKTNAYDETGFGATKALFLKKLNTLEEIREQKDKLVELEEYRETTKELSDRMGDLISRLSDMQTISSNKFMNYDYAASRLQEAMTKRNPIKHLNDEYGYGLDKKGSFAEDLSELIKDIKDSPARYFETKFERPVYLNEFAAAVVPKGTSKDVVDALTEVGLPIEEYESGNNEARMAAVDKVAVDNEGVRFRLSEKGMQIQAEVDKFTSKYNSKPVRIVEAEMDDNELMEALDNAFELEDVKSFMKESKTAAGYFHNLDKIIIFADKTKVERMEEYLFHENIHAAIHHNNFANLVAHFYEYAKNEAVFEKWSKLAHNKEYKQYNSSEEFLAYVLSNAMVARNLDDVAEYLEDKQKESLNKLFNVIGYDYDIRRRSNEQSGNGRTGERTPGESSLEGYELLNTGEGRGVGEGTGEGKGRKISPKERKARLNELFGKVADMGLQGVLGNKEYTSLMVDIYKALPEEVRAEIAEDAIRLYGGSVAPAVSDYIGPKSKNSIMDKVVTIVREVLRNVGFDLDLNANEVRYMAWRSKKPLDRNNMLEVAEDIDMKYRLKVGEYDGTTPDGGGTRFRTSEDVLNQIKQARKEVEKNPSEAQKEAGNYKKGHISLDGFEITLENPKGGTRSGVDKNGKKWSITMNNDYGYIRGTEAVDGDHIDVFLSDNPTEGRVFVVDQSNEDGTFDESKVMYGFNSLDEAREAYLSNYEKGWEKRIMAITEVSKDEFKKWIDSSYRKIKAFSEYKSIKSENNDIRFRVANKLQVRDEYEATIKKGGYQAREAVQDAMLSLRKFQELIEKATGKKIRDFENAWMHENRLSSVVQAEIHDMERRFYKPMMDAVKKLMKAANLEQEQVADYLMLKHGIERNREMAVRKALTDDKGKIDRTRLEQWYQDKRNVRNRAATPHLDTWRKQQEELDNIALLYGADMSRDYSGLTSMFGTDDLADSTQKAYDEVEALETAHPVETESLGKSIKAMTQNTLDKSFESGLMDRKVYDELSKDMYDYYIPLRGFEETTSEEVYAYLDQDRGAFNAPLKRAKGRSSKSDNPIAYLKSIAESGIMQGNRNKMKQSFLNMVINHPSDLVSVREGVWVIYNPATGEWEAASAPAIPNNATPADVEAAMEAWEQQMEQAAQNDPTLVKKVAEAADVPYRVVGNKMGQHQIIVKRLGKSYTLTVNGNPRLAMALNGQTNPNNTSNDGKFAAFVNNKIGSINRSLAAWYTTRNPDFVASNFMRDTFYTNTIVRAKEGNAYANKFHKNYAKVLPKMLGLFRKYENGTLDPADQTEAAFIDFMMNGGETGYSNLKDLEHIKKQIAKELKESKWDKAVTAIKLESLRWENIEAIAEKLDILNRAVENTARFAAFLTSREEGRSIAKSVFDAKEISVNFNKKGAGGTFFGMTGQTKLGNLAAMVGAGGRALYVFFNAAIQGSTNLMHVMKVNPKGTSAGLAAMFLMGAVVPFLFGGDDDEKDYYDLPEHVRRNHLIIPGTGDAWISIPLPIEYRIMYGIGELLTSWRTGHERGKDVARKMLSMTGQALPLNFLEEGLEAFVPSAISPIYQVMTNSSWTGLPIYKENDFNKDDPEYTKAYSNVDRNLLKFTKAVYEWTFDEENQEEGIDLNPAVIETLAKGYFGGLATQLSNIAKVGGMIAGEQEFDWRNIPIGNRILKTGDERTKEKRVTNEYFENMEKLDFLQSRERMLKKTEKGVAVPEADKFKAQKDLDTMQGTEIYKKYQEFKKQKKVVDKIRKTIKEKGSTPEREKQLMEAQEAANKSVR